MSKKTTPPTGRGRTLCPICHGSGAILEATQQYEFITRDPQTNICLICAGSGIIGTRQLLPNGTPVSTLVHKAKEQQPKPRSATKEPAAKPADTPNKHFSDYLNKHFSDYLARRGMTPPATPLTDQQTTDLVERYTPGNSGVSPERLTDVPVGDTPTPKHNRLNVSRKANPTPPQQPTPEQQASRLPLSPADLFIVEDPAQPDPTGSLTLDSGNIRLTLYLSNPAYRPVLNLIRQINRDAGVWSPDAEEVYVNCLNHYIEYKEATNG